MLTESEVKKQINKIYNGGPGSGNHNPGQGQGVGKPGAGAGGRLSASAKRGKDEVRMLREGERDGSSDGKMRSETAVIRDYSHSTLKETDEIGGRIDSTSDDDFNAMKEIATKLSDIEKTNSDILEYVESSKEELKKKDYYDDETYDDITTNLSENIGRASEYLDTADKKMFTTALVKALDEAEYYAENGDSRGDRIIDKYDPYTDTTAKSPDYETRLKVAKDMMEDLKAIGSSPQQAYLEYLNEYIHFRDDAQRDIEKEEYERAMDAAARAWEK